MVDVALALGRVTSAVPQSSLSPLSRLLLLGGFLCAFLEIERNGSGMVWGGCAPGRSLCSPKTPRQGVPGTQRSQSRASSGSRTSECGTNRRTRALLPDQRSPAPAPEAAAPGSPQTWLSKGQSAVALGGGRFVFSKMLRSHCVRPLRSWRDPYSKERSLASLNEARYSKSLISWRIKQNCNQFPLPPRQPSPGGHAASLHRGHSP